MRAWGSRYARLVLERCENNKRRACRELGISYHTLNAYLRFRPGVDDEPVVEEGGRTERPSNESAIRRPQRVVGGSICQANHCSRGVVDGGPGFASASALALIASSVGRWSDIGSHLPGRNRKTRQRLLLLNNAQPF